MLIRFDGRCGIEVINHIGGRHQYDCEKDFVVMFHAEHDEK